MIPATEGAHVPIRPLIRALHRHDAKHRWLAVLRLYADTSGKDSDLVRVGGCYIADEDAWDAFAPRWQEALDEAGVKQFHATDFFSFQGEFLGWDRDRGKHINFAKRFTEIAATSIEVGFALGVEVAPYKRIMAPVIADMRSLPHRKFTPLMMCATKLLHTIAAKWRPERGPIAALFEREEGIGEAIDYFDYLKDRLHAPWTQAFVSVGTAGKEFLPLQAADLLAHESFRRIKEYLRPTGRPMRKSFERLLQGGRVQVDRMGEAELRTNLPAIQQYMAEDRLY